MAFPQTPLPVVAEIFVNGAWTPISSRVRGAPDITISRGQANEQGEASPVTCDLTLNNRDGYLSNRNPTSALYGQIGKNTPIRIGATGTVVLMCPRYELAANRVTASDAAPLDIIGDIEIRIDFEPYSWRPAVPIMLASKYNAGGQASWALAMTSDGKVYFTWTTSGFSGTAVVAQSTAAIATSGRKALKVTLDVDNGGGGWTVAFATSDTINGTYAALGSTVTGSPTTSIFSSTTNLVIGSGPGGTPPFTGYESFGGRIYGFSLRNGIGGAEVAKADFTVQAEGASSFSDGLGNTWSKGGLARISGTEWRFHGELSSLPQEWDPTGKDVWVPAQAAGVKRRLTQGTQPVTSASYRALAIKALTGWWPCEDGTSSTTIASAVPGAPAATVLDTTVGSDDALPTSAGAITFNSSASTMHGDCNDTGANTNNAQFFFYFKFPSIPAFEVQLFTVFMTGGASFPFFCIYTTATTYKVNFFDSGGNVIATSSTAFGADGTPDQWIAMWMDLTQSGGNVQWNLSWYPVSKLTFYSFGGGLSFVGTLGRIKSFQVWDRSGRDGMQLAHIAATQSNYNFYSADFSKAAQANVSELVSERIDRIAEEEGVIFNLRGSRFDTEQMGPQLPGTSWALMQEAADLDGGILAESRDYVGVFYRTRVDMHNQQAVNLDYPSKHLWQELRPIDDDQNTRNIVTVTRSGGGSSAIAKQTTGPLSINAPTDVPAGVGPYKSEVSRNSFTDARLLALAQYEVLLGTVDELRYAAVSVNCARSAIVSSSLFNAIPGIDMGDEISLTGLPVWLPPGTTELLVYGVTERITNRSTSRSWEFSFRCAPYSPYRVNNLTSYDTSRQKAGTQNTTLKTAVNSSATSLIFKIADGKAVWVTSPAKPSLFPFDILLGGEQCTVTALDTTVWTANPYFETNANNWTGFGGAIVRTTAQFHEGVASLQLTPTGVAATSRTECDPVVVPTVGQAWTVSAWVRNAVARNVSININWFDGSAVYLSTTAGTPVALAANTWTFISLTGTAPASTAQMSMSIDMTGTPPASNVLFVDEAKITYTQYQTATVTRSVNGVSKAQSAGTSIDVFKSFKATR